MSEISQRFRIRARKFLKGRVFTNTGAGVEIPVVFWERGRACQGLGKGKNLELDTLPGSPEQIGRTRRPSAERFRRSRRPLETRGQAGR